MKHSIVVVLLMLVNCLSAQEKTYPRLKENQKWLENFKTISAKGAKIDFIKSKIYSDTSFLSFRNRIILDNSRDPEKHVCKILFFLKSKKHHCELDLETKPSLSKVFDLINEKNIQEIEVIELPESAALFGSNNCGVIILNCDKMLMQKARNVL
ncbi:hypothetical protein HUK80_17900 [Flavobacterium sp. MAH-1]|uniref:DUF4154 domain-containing protein n=1 Tax=Flavobacterium agri TaxID=2743471 RepID=A0A7Y9C7W3_9FLAO|nr:hypothetical protein [Flavobacterium agri]NUY82777.1 hypothetical protein [Flavobacterium agri]NYA72799.1 hypothetical protein [Flavobacterium agri]